MTRSNVEGAHLPKRPLNSASGSAPSVSARLITLRKKGVPNSHIAAELGIPLHMLYTEVQKLVKEGVLTSRKGLLRAQPEDRAEGHERTRRDLAPAVRRLYRQRKSYREIGSALNLTHSQVHGIMTELFAAGLPKRPTRRLTDKQVRAIHARYLKGASIDKLAAKIGFTGQAVRARMLKLGLPRSSARKRGQPS
jgi:DNA-binding Lrp family transcriptional regulator